MQILLSGGGTGGHVYPVLTIVEHLRAKNDTSPQELLYLGGQDSFEEKLAQRQGIPFRAISVGGLRGASPITIIRNGARLAQGVIQSLRAITAFRPQVTLATGGYASVPAVIASWLCRCPVLIYLPDIEPGLAVGTLSRFAKHVAVSFEESARYFPPGKAVVTGYPVRARLYETDKPSARSRLGLSSDLPVLLVLGGSRGAHSINMAVAEHLDRLLAQAQLVHICGPGDYAGLQERRQELTLPLRQRYHLYDYLHEEMVDALAAADLAVARAGAATLAEFPAVGLPAILVPYPYAGQHQAANADYLVKHGAARKLEDSRLRDELMPMIEELLSNPAMLAEMGRQARRLARPDAAENIAALLRQLATERSSTPIGGANGYHSD